MKGGVSFIENCSVRIIVLWGSGLGHFVASYLFIYLLFINIIYYFIVEMFGGILFIIY